MTVLLSQLAEPRLGYDFLHTADSVRFFSETVLCVYAKAMPVRLQAARGKKRGVETGYFYSNAMALGRIAVDLGQVSNEPVLAVLFRDCDGTCSSPVSLWADKWRSMQDGFSRSGFEHGVPMLPKPKSEAWLLCAASPELTHCAGLEDISGNDNSPNSAKLKLSVALNGHTSADELCEWLAQNPVDAERASAMPSFRAFHDALGAALDRVLH